MESRRVGRRTIYSGKVIDLHVDTVEYPDGERREREIVEHPGAVAIVAMDGDELVLVRQDRAPAGRALLEIPAGTRDRLPNGAVEDPDDTARRELAEETGFEARGWRHLARFWTAPGFATEVMDLYLATDLAPAKDASAAEDERITVERASLAHALEMVDSGAIADAKSIVGILWVARMRSADPG